MKSKKKVLIFLAAFLMAPFLITDAGAAKWKLYDNFESQAIDSKKWSKIKDGEVAHISVEEYNGSWQAKFDYIPDNPDSSCWLKFNHPKICPETIVGIKAKVTIAPGSSRHQEGRARIGFHPGVYDDYYMWGAIRVRSYRSNISGGCGLVDQDAWSWVRDLCWSSFDNTLDPIGEQYTIYAIFDKKNSITVGVEGQGETTYKLPGKGKIGDPIEIFRGIGIRISSGLDVNAPFTAYFDDVYIMTKGKCDKKAPKIKKIVPKKNAKKVDRNIEYIELHFSEPMQNYWQVKTTGGWDLASSLPNVWSADRKSLLFYRANSSTALDPNTTIEIIFNPKEWIGQPKQDYFFRDAKGNFLKQYKYKFTTGD